MQGTGASRAGNLLVVYGLFLPFMNEAVISWGQPNVGDVVIGPTGDVFGDGVNVAARLHEDSVALRESRLRSVLSPCGE